PRSRPRLGPIFRIPGPYRRASGGARHAKLPTTVADVDYPGGNMTDSNNPWLTQESYDKLKSELDALYENRPIIAAEINERREEGDLKENAGYDAAREQQGQEEARIRYLEDLLQRAVVGETPQESGVALVGTVVHVYYDGDEDDKETFLIGTRGVDSSKPGLETYFTDSPLGRA